MGRVRKVKQGMNGGMAVLEAGLPFNERPHRFCFVLTGIGNRIMVSEGGSN